jgi:hypothetical protein
MKKRRILVVLGILVGGLVGLWIIFFFPHGFHTPDIEPPAGSKNVRFFERGGWQSFQYYYRIDNEPHISIEFAKNLIREHGFREEISTEQFTSIPENRAYPAWFTPNEINNGIMILGGGFADAYIDMDSGRLYFKIWH